MQQGILVEGSTNENNDTLNVSKPTMEWGF